MVRKPDWEALGALFAQPSCAASPEPDIASDGGSGSYMGEIMPEWLACDLMQERVAICEYDGGMTRAEAEALNGLVLNET